MQLCIPDKNIVLSCFNLNHHMQLEACQRHLSHTCPALSSCTVCTSVPKRVHDDCTSGVSGCLPSHCHQEQCERDDGIEMAGLGALLCVVL